jgi:hypothetical protein
VLWTDLLKRGVKIHFAHRTFQWSSEASGKAAVHCVIIGFGLRDAEPKRLFDYETLQAEAHESAATNINPYLVDAPDVMLESLTSPLCAVPEMVNGSKPTDGGNLLLSAEEKSALVTHEPMAEKWIRPYAMSDEFINGIHRYCLWLTDCPPDQLRQMPMVMARVKAVQKMRNASKDAQTKKDAATPMLFQKIRQPDSGYLVIPRVSSERRYYIPIAFALKELVAGETLQTIPNATTYHFGVLTSAMHMAWVRSTCGRLKSDYRYSASIVYNNFPWPPNISDKQKQTVEEAAQGVLDARALYPQSSLADLYNPLTMPLELVKAHHKLDAAVDTAYSKRKFSGDTDRVAFLFDLYQQIASPLESKKVAQKQQPKRKHKEHAS